MKKNKKGFTLVELVMVIAILVVIAIIALPNFTSSIDRNLSRQDRKVEKALKSSGELYLKDNIEDKMILETIENKDYCYFSVNSLIASDYVAADDVYDYSDGCLIFNKNDNEYFVNKVFENAVCAKKDNSIKVSQKCVNYLDTMGKISPIRLYVEVDEGTKYKKNNKATITLEDTSGHGLKNESVKIYYDWDTNYKKCEDFPDTSYIELTLNDDRPTKISGVVEISGDYTGKGQIYVCNKDIIENVDGNDLAKYAMDSASMYLDNEKPEINDVSSFENEISFKLKDDDSGVVGYAVTTDKNVPTKWESIDKEDGKYVDTYEINVGFDDYGVYYIWAKDAVGNISDPKEYDTVKTIEKPTCKKLTYTGKSQNLVNIPDDAGYILNTNSGINAGSYSIEATLKEGYRWEDNPLDSVTFQCSIGEKKLEVSKFTYEPITKVYDGTTNVSSDFSIVVNGESGLVTGDSVGVTYTGASYDSKNVGTSRKITVSGLSLNGEDKDNYKLSGPSYVKSGAEITAKPVPEFSISPTSYTYDGTAKKPTITIVYDSVKLVEDTDYTVTFKNNTNVGTATVTVKGKGNYTGTKTKTFKIEQKAITVTATNQSKTYDGTALKANSKCSITSGSLVDGHTIECTNTGSRTIVGEATKTLGTVIIKSGTVNVTSNYNITKKNGTLTVTRSKTATVAECKNLTYNGQSQSLVSGGSNISYSNSAKTSAGTYTVTMTPDSNYAWSDGTYSSKTLNCSIGKKAVTYTASSSTQTYNGTALTSNNASLTSGSLVSGHTASFTVNGSITNVGSVDNTLKSVTIKNGSTDVTSNYNITKKNGTLTVTRSKTATLGSCNSLTYNGSAQTLASGGINVNYTYNSGTNAINYEVTVTPKANYAWSDGTYSSKTLNCSIGKKAVTYTASSSTQTYNGTALTSNNVSLTSGSLVNGHTASFTVNGSITNVGSVTNTLQSVVIKSGTINVSGNYKITMKNGTLTVTRAKSATTGSCNSLTYNGVSQTLASGGVNVNYAYNSGTNATNYEVTVTPKANYEWITGGTIEKHLSCSINKKSLAVTWGSTTSFKYTGTGQAPSVTTPITGVNGEKVNIQRTTKVDVGTYSSTASCSSVSGGRANCNNYSLTNTTKAFTITPASGSVIIKYSANASDASITASTSGGSWSLVNGLVHVKNNNNVYVYTTTLGYNTSLSTDGLTNYNNTGWMNITRSGYVAKGDAEWKCLSGCSTSNKTFSQREAYSSSDFCDASEVDCEVVLGVNWLSASINGDRYVCNENTKRLAIYYITTCDGFDCQYTKKNGLNSTFTNAITQYDVDGAPTWKVVRSTLSGSLSATCKDTLYISANGGFDCRTGANDSLRDSSITYGQCKSVTVYKTTMASSRGSGNNWYYELDNKCYIDGYYLKSTDPCSSSGNPSNPSNPSNPTTPNVELCGRCSSTSQCKAGTCGYYCSGYSCCGYVTGNMVHSCN